MFDAIRQDYFASRARRPFNALTLAYRALQDAGFRAMMFYRLGRWGRRRRMRLLALLAERAVHHLCHVWISTEADIGPGLRIAHVCGIVVPPGIVIGRNCEIRQNVTLGGNFGKLSPEGRTNPRLGDNVSLGPGCVLLGPIEVGDNSVIGANAVLTQSVPPDSVVAGWRAEIVATRAADGSMVRSAPNVFLSRRELYERLELMQQRLDSVEKELADAHRPTSST
jgi:serine O-acetyltransferase